METGEKNALLLFQNLLGASLENRTESRSFYVYDGLAPIALVLAQDSRLSALPFYDRLRQAALQELAADARALAKDDLDFLTGWTGHAFLSAGLGDDGALAHLASLAGTVADPAAAPLCCFPRDDTEHPVIDLGLAHGNIGLLSVLALCGRTVPEVTAMAQALLCQLEAHELPDGPSRFPYFAGQAGPSRIGWCYGDLSMLIGLTQCAAAGIGPKDPALFDRVEQALLDRLAAGAALEDAFLCHGTAGLIAISVFLQGAGKPRLATLRAALHETLDAQLRPVLEQDNCSTDLLNGMSGVGLALLSSQTGRRLPWQTLFLT
ncbi:lanthionine synthetase LanC family protein [Tateyamaria omphalii]|uniref:lanthionine synthetase LanC family protein n=1 Tax=Tateyamaria omphalii TaxID=299262 RepID=UPI0015615584|nr:lanthionine synthetase LanC family protein [Tateyamaria omphalii]